LLSEFIKFGVPAKFFSIIFSLTVFLFFFLGIPEYANYSHTTYQKEGEAESNPVRVGKEYQVFCAGRVYQNQVQSEFTECINDQAESNTEYKYIPVTIAVWQIIPEDIADDPTGAEQQAVGRNAINHCDIHRKAIVHHEQRVQKCPDYPPTKKAVAKFADADGGPGQRNRLNNFQKLVFAIVKYMGCLSVREFNIQICIVSLLNTGIKFCPIQQPAKFI
jgi:hypothetical protein